MNIDTAVRHQPVLLNDVVKYLVIDKNGIYVDATFGGGGHSKAILECLNSKGCLLVIDKDISALKIANSIEDSRVIMKQGSFAQLYKFVEELHYVNCIHGILLDLGVSSIQLDDVSRGFSFMKDGPLDMRMDVINQKLTASELINTASVDKLTHIFKFYGEEKFSRKIAKAIVQKRKKNPIISTLQLVSVITDAKLVRVSKSKNLCYGNKNKRHPATKVFQAIRIFINNELEELSNVLEQSLDVLVCGGRLLVIAFHSLEAKIIKHFIRKYASTCYLPCKIPIKQENIVFRIKKIGKTIKSSIEELKLNVRARSARLYVLEKIL